MVILGRTYFMDGPMHRENVCDSASNFHPAKIILHKKHVLLTTLGMSHMTQNPVRLGGRFVKVVFVLTPYEHLCASETALNRFI